MSNEQQTLTDEMPTGEDLWRKTLLGYRAKFEFIIAAADGAIHQALSNLNCCTMELSHEWNMPPRYEHLFKVDDANKGRAQADDVMKMMGWIKADEHSINDSNATYAIYWPVENETNQIAKGKTACDCQRAIIKRAERVRKQAEKELKRVNKKLQEITE